MYGVTGSGKTRVIKAMIDRVLADGRQVIVLVPEISLTPQTVSYFSGVYGDRTVVIHSMLSHGERYDAYRRIKRGEARICIRNALGCLCTVRQYRSYRHRRGAGAYLQVRLLTEIPCAGYCRISLRQTPCHDAARVGYSVGGELL